MSSLRSIALSGTTGRLRPAAGAALAALLLLVLGALVGLVNGLVTTLLKVPSFIVTLGTMLALLGLVAYATYDLTNQATLRDWPWRVTMAALMSWAA